ncbi:FAD-dependent monooxygenase [Microvirga sp. BT689]|uniref:FAD-dependent monooxygenase n=1 Tax=Microvirga arvi TaxID=2778731 RepID=UPI0019502007|nr:FAD-dependent monooxygenase [Microvirga arvi]MBM6584341.1 FAD-dependent monooxygenase [Microvirga arvi]
MKVACVGAGPAGLYFAILMKLSNAKNDITVFERNPAGTTHGWGVVFWDDLLNNLSRNDPQSAREIIEHSFRWPGQVVDMKGKQRVHQDSSGYAICRRELLAILTNRAIELGVEIQFKHEIAQVEQLPHADLIVAADGVGSQLRRLHADQFKTHISVGRNKYAWLGTTQVFSEFTFGFVPTKAGWIWFHAYAFKKDMSTFIVECAPETWTGLGFNKLNAVDSLRLLEDLFKQHLDGHQLITHASESKSLPWLNFRNLDNETWCTDNLVLIGDAAHTTHFTIGSGTRLAIEDAIALVNALGNQDEVKAAVKVYESERQRALMLPRRQARLSARWFESLTRYTDLDTPEFLMLMMNRRSPLIPYMPPRVYCQLHTALLRDSVFRKLYRGVAAVVGSLRRQQPSLR